MGVKRYIPAVLSVLAVSCGGGDIFPDQVGGFDTAIVYIQSVTPQPLEADIFTRTLEPQSVFTNVNKTDCSETKVADVCTGIDYLPDTVSITIAWEVRGDFARANDPARNPNALPPSPVFIESATLSFERLTPGCPDIGTRRVAVGAAVSQDSPTAQFSLDVLSQDIKRSVANNYGTTQTLVYLDPDSGCRTNFVVRNFNLICTYRVSVYIQGVELFTGKRDSIKTQLTLRLSDFQTDKEGCQI